MTVSDTAAVRRQIVVVRRRDTGEPSGVVAAFLRTLEELRPDRDGPNRFRLTSVCGLRCAKADRGEVGPGHALRAQNTVSGGRHASHPEGIQLAKIHYEADGEVSA